MICVGLDVPPSSFYKYVCIHSLTHPLDLYFIILHTWYQKNVCLCMWYTSILLMGMGMNAKNKNRKTRRRKRMERKIRMNEYNVLSVARFIFFGFFFVLQMLLQLCFSTLCFSVSIFHLFLYSVVILFVHSYFL